MSPLDRPHSTKMGEDVPGCVLTRLLLARPGLRDSGSSFFLCFVYTLRASMRVCMHLCACVCSLHMSPQCLAVITDVFKWMSGSPLGENENVISVLYGVVGGGGIAVPCSCAHVPLTPLTRSKQHLLGELAGPLWTLWDQVWAVEGPCSAKGLCTRVGTRARTACGGSCWARRGWGGIWVVCEPHQLGCKCSE